MLRQGVTNDEKHPIQVAEVAILKFPQRAVRYMNTCSTRYIVGIVHEIVTN